VQTAVGGQAAGDLYEEGSDRHFPLVVRLAPKYRETVETISGLTIAVQDPATNKVAQIPLTEVASINLVSGPAFIYREQQQRYIPIKFSVRGRDLGSTVLEAQRRSVFGTFATSQGRAGRSAFGANPDIEADIGEWLSTNPQQT
jgi:cobalt-zinc-cadmium resistance protein CzcA